MEFGLFYFANDSGPSEVGETYDLLLSGAKFADRAGFSAIWTPERHFHPFGGSYPNPAVTSAAISTCTERISIRGGSVVAPFHNPIRIAEEWSVVDNLSGGRVGISFASGWNAVDFVLAPDRYKTRYEVMVDTIKTVQKLWQGESLELLDGTGTPTRISLRPRPIQSRLPIWIASAGSESSPALAGALQASLLTHFGSQDIANLEKRIAIYRKAFVASSGGAVGHVTLMIHTYIGDSVSDVRDIVREPLSAYLRSSFDLETRSAERMSHFNRKDVTDAQINFLVGRAFNRYFETSGLFGTPTSALTMVRQLKAIGVDELACLVDFGVPNTLTKLGFEKLEELFVNCQELESDSE